MSNNHLSSFFIIGTYLKTTETCKLIVFMVAVVHRKVNLNTTHTSHKAHEHFSWFTDIQLNLYDIAIIQGNRNN